MIGRLPSTARAIGRLDQRAMKVLIVDDEPRVLQALNRVLRHTAPKDWVVTTAESGSEALAKLGAAPVRLHGCYIDEVEIHRVVAHLKTQGRPVYNLAILKPREEEDGGDGGDGGAPGGGNKVDDEMYDKAVNIVCSTRNASISWVQRQLRIGYNRAARLVEEMEKQGVVSGPDHTNKREVLVAAA